MRLLDTSTLQFQEFWGSALPRYAILSHTWEADEVSFHEMRDDKGLKSKAGYSKILSSCALAAKDGFKYVWVDTCCIDKTSSAELSEAINSMFQWYAKAEVCYAYLTDVIMFNNDHPRTMQRFRKSRWFTRGWTLQELLAPSMVIFYGQDWKEIGTRLSLSEEISSCTGIACSDVIGFRRNERHDSKEANIAVKMSWASKRRTTRTEDTAYCLLGIFGVNMPLLYGEGNAAFIRLQLEILKTSDDETIFAWNECKNYEHHTGLLATSPAAFRESGRIRQVLYDKGRPEYSMTNKGLRVEFLLSQAGMDPSWQNVYGAVLNCTQEHDDLPLEILLQRNSNNRHSAYGSSASSTEPMQFTRFKPSYALSGLDTVSPKRLPHYLIKERTVVYVKQKDNSPDALFKYPMVSIRYPATLFRVSEVWPPNKRYTWKETGECDIATVGEPHFGAMFESHDKNYPERFAILVTDLPALLVPLAVTLVIVPPGTETFGNGKIVQFFNSKLSKSPPNRQQTV